MEPRGPFTCKFLIDSHSTRQSGEHKYGSVSLQAVKGIWCERGLRSLARTAHWRPHTCLCLCVRASRSARAQAHRPDPGQAGSHCSGHLHTGGSQTERRQFHVKVGCCGHTVPVSRTKLCVWGECRFKSYRLREENNPLERFTRVHVININDRSCA